MNYSVQPHEPFTQSTKKPIFTGYYSIKKYVKVVVNQHKHHLLLFIVIRISHCLL